MTYSIVFSDIEGYFVIYLHSNGNLNFCFDIELLIVPLIKYINGKQMDVSVLDKILY